MKSPPTPRQSCDPSAAAGSPWPQTVLSMCWRRPVLVYGGSAYTDARLGGGGGGEKWCSSRGDKPLSRGGAESMLSRACPTGEWSPRRRTPPCRKIPRVHRRGSRACRRGRGRESHWTDRANRVSLGGRSPGCRRGHLARPSPFLIARVSAWQFLRCSVWWCPGGGCVPAGAGDNGGGRSMIPRWLLCALGRLMPPDCARDFAAYTDMTRAIDNSHAGARPRFAALASRCWRPWCPFHRSWPCASGSAPSLSRADHHFSERTGSRLGKSREVR